MISMITFSSKSEETASGVPNVIFEERLNGKFSELQLQFSLILRVARPNLANLANPTNFSGNSPDSPDSTRIRKF